ncbi:DUF4123 domain-containing protein (plasmid) [Enterobacteriaceae bacterium Kacie_13]|nr:DUF4123 domain-containing protein [Enterobacteriaceae bacterium Kacie_13]
MEQIRYAIIDGAVEVELVSFLSTQTFPHCCLYSPPVQPEIVELAPYLVQMTPEVDEWLKFRTTPWGITLFSAKPLHLVLQHLRRYLWVKIPEQEKTVLLRFYDPRNIWAILDVLTPLELSSFIGPISKILTHYEGYSHQENFEFVYEEKDSSSSAKEALVLSSRQFKKLNKLTQTNYINKLACFIRDYYLADKDFLQPDMAALHQQAEDYLFFCHAFNIVDSRSVRGITLALLKKGITRTAEIPQQWEELLSNSTQSIYYQVEKLLLRELGYIPE